MRRTAQGFTLIEIMVVIAIIAGLVTTVAVIVPRMQESQRQTGCLNNLSQLGQVYLMEEQENKGRAQKYSGVSLWLSYRKGKDKIKRGDERALMCPGDKIATPDTPDDQKKWDNVDLDNPTADLCSYAARDFKNSPTKVDSPDKEIIGCDRQGENGKTMHHVNVIICVYSGGDAQKVTKEMLGVSSESDIGIGEAAEPNSQLKKVVYIVRRKD